MHEVDSVRRAVVDGRGPWARRGRVLAAAASLFLGVAPARGQSAAVRLAGDFVSLRAAAPPSRVVGPAVGTYDVVALRVQFLPDTTRFTTGDGTFAAPLFGPGLAASVDPEPHDADYFGAHLAFLRNYVETVSDGRASVRTWLLPRIVTVTGRMGEYSPTGAAADSDPELAKLARFVREAWSLADGSVLEGAGLDPSRTAFVLFHAGVGRDIELTGTTLDRTPEDLPSLFLSSATLERLAPGATPTVGGLPVTNTLVVPRTETRRGIDFIADEPFLAEFSINGLLAASFLNFLGVPDLFDTTTGQSAVGPFDVMDGLGIFAMSGLFPPEPSAWTRATLGWADEMEAGPAAREFDLPWAGAPDPASVLRVPVSSAEYFLVENRYRGHGGVRLDVWKDGAVSVVVFANDDASFNPYSIAGFTGGVVLAADPYDFALPGGIDEDGNPLVGGALVWHVDARRLARTLTDNRVNADPEGRSIDLEEADGAQDIGHASTGFFGPQYEVGTPFDFWYRGNPVSVLTRSGQPLALYQNRFGPDTVPDSRANDGGPSFVEISGFSEPGETMTVTAGRVAEFGVSPPVALWERPRDLGEAWSADFASLRLTDAGFLLHAFGSPNGGITITGDWAVTGVLDAEPAIDGRGWAYVLEPGHLRVITPEGSRRVAELPVGFARRATTPLVVVSAEPAEMVVGILGDGGPRLLTVSDGRATTTPEPETVVSLALTDAGRLVVSGLTTTRVEGEDLTWIYSALDPYETYRPMFGRDREGLFGAIASRGAVRLLGPEGSVVTLGHDLPASGLPGQAAPTELDIADLSTATTVADLDGDGLLEAVIASKERVWAFHRTGAVVDGFPIELQSAMGPGALLVTRLTDSGGKTILVGLADGTVDAFDLGRGARRVPGFPLAVGSGPVATPFVAEDRIGAVDASGILRAWAIDHQALPAMHLSSVGNSSFLVADDAPAPSGAARFLLDPGETYNWPNPVDGGNTWIRFATAEPADVTIRIIDLSGRLVAVLDRVSVPADVPAEVGWSADVPSGVYVARVHAETADGRSEDRLVKIAVIR